MGSRTVVVLVCTLLCAAALGAFGAPPAAASTATIWGSVTDSSTGLPVQGARVNLVWYCWPGDPMSMTEHDPDRWVWEPPSYSDTSGLFSVTTNTFLDPDFRPALCWSKAGYAGNNPWYGFSVEVVSGFGYGVFRQDLTLTDITPPVTSQSGGDADWQTGPITVRFSASDPGSGVDHTEYRVNGGLWRTGTSVRFAVIRHKRGGGTFTVDYRSVDKAGNVEADKSCTVQLL